MKNSGDEMNSFEGCIKKSLGNPRYTHDCSACIFLGAYNEYDLYFCYQGGNKTVIARYGLNGTDYHSGLMLAATRQVHEHVHPELRVAYLIASDCEFFSTEDFIALKDALVKVQVLNEF